MNTAIKDEPYPLIPLFPLGLVLLPHMDLPLHIFEERYKIMINMCLENDQAFGMVFFDGAVIQKIGCTAEIQSVIRHYDDGRMDILTRGERRFIIRDMDESRPFIQARVLFFEDDADAAVADDIDLKADTLRLLKDLDRLSETRRDYSALAKLDTAVLSFIIPGLEGFTPQERQPFLETTSPRRRLQKCRAALDTVIKRMQLNAEIQNAVGGNGDLKVLLAKAGLRTD
jgi:Lon protease-like protein